MTAQSTEASPTGTGTGTGTSLAIDFWLDLGCPWCYLGRHRLDLAIQASDRPVELTLRSFELNPGMSTEPIPVLEYLAGKFAGTVKRARAADGQVAALAAADGLPYTSDRRIANTFDAHRILHLARTSGVANEMFATLQRGYFGGDLDPFQPETLRRVAAGAGIPAERVDEVLGGDAYADAVRQELAAGRRLGITGVPFTVLAGRYAVAGAQSVEAYAEAIRMAQSDPA